MTAVSGGLQPSAILPSAVRPSAAGQGLVRTSLILAGRVVRTFLRSRVMVISTVLFPLLQLFMLLAAFRLLVHSATGEAYVVHLAPLMALVTAWSAILSSSIGFWTDLNSGIFTRLRAMPINMSSVLIGRVIGDLVRIMSAAAVIVLCALIPGFRLSRGVVAAVGFFLLIALFGAMCSAVSIAVGMSAQHPGIIVKWVQLPTLTLTLMSSGYVPLHAFPGWIQPLVAVNPISVNTEALVGLSHGGPLLVPLIGSLAWIAFFAAVASVVARRRLRVLLDGRA